MPSPFPKSSVGEGERKRGAARITIFHDRQIFKYTWKIKQDWQKRKEMGNEVGPKVNQQETKGKLVA